MIAYAESNFVLELAFLQEQHESCGGILVLAEQRRIALAVPAFSVAEPHEVLTRRARRRREIALPLKQEIHELSRSRPYGDLAEQSRQLVDVLMESGDHEKRRLASVLDRLLSVAEVIPTDAAVLRDAIAFQDSLGLSPQDAIIYASVLRHMQHAPPVPKCFLNRNSKDFLVPGIEEELRRRHCRLIPQFTDGLRYIEGRLTSEAATL